MLTNTQAREAKPRAARYEITCDALPGFILRVLPTGKKVFFARYRGADGKDHRHRLGLMSPSFNADEARRAAMIILATREGQASVHEPPPGPWARPAVPAPAPASTPIAARHSARAAAPATPATAPAFAPAATPVAPATSPASPPAAAPASPTTIVAADSPTAQTSVPATVAAAADVETSIPSTPVSAAASRVPTVREFAARFDEEHIAVYLKPGTAVSYRSSLRNYILPTFGDRRLDEITTSDIQRFHNSLKEKSCAANNARCVLSVMFNKADAWEVTARRNPVTIVRRFDQNAVERFLTPEERQALERVLAAAQRIPLGNRGHIGQDAIWAIRLLTLTGMRRNEIRDLRWEHVDWRQSLLRLPDSKTGKRDVIVSDEVIALLRSIAEAKHHPKRGLVVCSRTGIKLYSLGATWLSVRKQAGIPDVRLHDLRHSVASDAIMNGVPLEVVGKMLGHRNYQTTQRYAHIADTVLRAAVNLTSRTIVKAAEEGAPK